MDLGQRVIGGVVGLALGDALGAPYEFRRASAIPSPLPAFTEPWMGLPPGTTTDDTAMARNLVRSLVASEGFDAADLVARHVAWWRTRPPDVGVQTSRVLARAADGADATTAARALLAERGPEVSAGNGSVMYCAPLGLAYAHRPDALADLAPRLSALTHADGRCATGVLAVTLAIASLTRGHDARDAVADALGAARPHEGGEELEFLVDAVGDSRSVDGPDQGFCLYAAAVGLQAVARDDDAATALLRVVALGGDTDTNAAVAGALLGARDGVGSFPDAWRSSLRERAGIEDEARGLIALASVGAPEGLD